MVGAFAGLKWRLVSSRVRAAKGGLKAWIIVGWCFGVLLLVLLAFLIAGLRSDPELAATVAVSVFTLQLVSWVLGPLVAFGIDETVDPAKFALLPLTPGTLQRGLLVASVIGYLPAANAVVLLGVAVSLSSSWALLPIAVLCICAQLLLCITISRAASAAMSGLMAGRRGRDLGMVIGSLLFLAYVGLSFGLNRTASSASSGESGRALESGFASLAHWLSYGPNGALARLPSAVAGSEWLRAGIAAGTAVAALALSWWWWSWSLRRSLTTLPSTTEGSAPVAVDNGRAGSAPVADSLRGTVALMIARDRILTWRDPMRRLPWLLIAGLALLWPLLVVRGHGSLFAVAFPAVMVGMQAGNQFGVEGTGLWLHMVAFADGMRARGEALGHAVFVIIPGTVIVVLAVLLQALIRHDLKWVPAALGMCLAIMMGSVACTGYLSARLPFAMRQSRKSMFANSMPGQKGRTLGSSLASMGGGILVGIPAIGCVVLALNTASVWGWVGLVVGPICGGLAVLLLSGLTAATYLSRTPEILQVVALGDRS